MSTAKRGMKRRPATKPRLGRTITDLQRSAIKVGGKDQEFGKSLLKEIAADIQRVNNALDEKPDSMADVVGLLKVKVDLYHCARNIGTEIGLSQLNGLPF